MTAAPTPDDRVLVLAPTGRDAALTRDLLGRAGVAAVCCPDLEAVCAGLAAGAGAVLLAEEAAAPGRTGCLTDWLAAQPPWSDLPVLLLARSGADSPAVARAIETLGNVTVLERPTRVATLVTAVRTALRARRRQYQAREHLADRERAADEVRATERRFRELVEQVRDYAIFTTDPAGRATSWNEGVRRVLGFDEAEFLGADLIPTIFTPEDVASGVPQAELAEAAATGRAANDRWMRRKDGTRFFALGVTTGLRDDAGGLLGFLKVMRDQTDRKRMEDELRRVAADLAEADRRKNEFLATLAHELRNPLAPIRNSLHVLRLAGPGDPAARRVGEMVERQVNTMVRLVDDLLEVSRVTRGKVDLRREPVELAAVVRAAVETSRPLLDAAGHRLAVAVPDGPLAVAGDPVRLAQVFSNLLNNAAKYTPPGGRVWLTARRDGGEAEVSVRDTGAGIPADMLAAVFEPFTQVARTDARSQGGLGIGLTLVKNLVELHGGRVEAHSDGEGKGTEVVVRLPLTARPVPAAAPDPPAGRAAPIARRVLVADDNRDAADSLGDLLRLLGADVRVVYDGPAALAAVAAFRPAVALLDIGMPGMDGYEVARRVRERPGSDAPALVALTGWGQDEDRRRSAAAGFDHHLVKPADVAALAALLRSVGNGHP